MGCLASCCGGGEEKLVQMKQLDSPVRVQSVSKDVKMDPSGLELSGHGIGLGSEALEQDSSYWEVHVKACAEGSSNVCVCVWRNSLHPLACMALQELFLVVE
jgi:hypothetical protein